MSRLSPDSVAAFKGKNNDPSKIIDTTRLLSELSQIAQSIINSTKASFSKWSMSCDVTDANAENFACTFTTSHEEVKEIKLRLQVVANGDSYIEAGLENNGADASGLINQIAQLMKSPAAKKYFVIPVKGVAKIKATIPKREVVSRYFEDYVQHLINQLEPFINSMVAHQLKLQ